MTIIVETNVSTFERIKSGKITFIVNKFRRPVAVGDKIVFQEVNDEDKHTENEESYEVTQIETDGVKAGYLAVAFQPWQIKTANS